nr:ERCC4 domain-containing protein [Vibrio sp. 04Ya108]
MLFTLWSKGQTFRVYVKGGQQPAVLTIGRDKKLKCDCDDDLFAKRVLMELEQGGVDVAESVTTTQLIERFKSSSLQYQFSGDLKDVHSSPKKRAIQPEVRFDGVEFKTPKQLHDESLFYDLYKIPYRDRKLLADLELICDSREPESLQEMLQNCIIDNVKVSALEIGDVMISNPGNNDTIIFERKTATDLVNSIKSGHLHDQAERLFDYQHALMSNGIRCRVIWIIEADHNGNHSYYNSLPDLVNLDGVSNYLIGILNQHILHTFSTKHTAYAINKIASGFFEQALFYRVNTARTKTQRPSEVLQATTTKSEHGVSVSKREGAGLLSQINGINQTVAEALANQGVTIAKLCKMSHKELCGINGVGPKGADKIMLALGSN